MKNTPFIHILLSIFSIALFSCQKELPAPLDSPGASATVGVADDREACNMQLTAIYSALPNWDAALYAFNNGAWVLVAQLGGPKNPNPGVIKLDNGQSVSLGIDGYKQYKIVQNNGNLNYGIQAPSGRFTKVVYAGSTYTFYAGCEPLPACTMSVRIGNACETTWEAQIIQNLGNGGQSITHIGGLGSNAPIKIRTGRTHLLPIAGFTGFTFLQLSGTTNYIVNVPSEGQFSFTLDTVNGSNPCQAGASLPTSYEGAMGCTGL